MKPRHTDVARTDEEIGDLTNRNITIGNSSRKLHRTFKYSLEKILQANFVFYPFYRLFSNKNGLQLYHVLHPKRRKRRFTSDSSNFMWVHSLKKVCFPLWSYFSGILKRKWWSQKRKFNKSHTLWTLQNIQIKQATLDFLVKLLFTFRLIYIVNKL